MTGDRQAQQDPRIKPQGDGAQVERPPRGDPRLPQDDLLTRLVELPPGPQPAWPTPSPLPLRKNVLPKAKLVQPS